jgi:hypothetical protein
MKNIKIHLLILCIFASINLFAQQQHKVKKSNHSTSKEVVKVEGKNILRFGANYYNIDITYGTQSYYGGTFAYERMINQHLSLAASVQYGGKYESVIIEEQPFKSAKKAIIKATNFILAPEIRWYQNATGNGFYAGFQPAIHQYVTTLCCTTSKLAGTAPAYVRFGTMGQIGYQINVLPKITAQLNAGYGFLFDGSGARPFSINAQMGIKF